VGNEKSEAVGLGERSEQDASPKIRPVDGIYLKRSWGGEVWNVAVLVAIGVNRAGFREVIGVVEGTKEDSDNRAIEASSLDAMGHEALLGYG
jgi:transposase-like protein